MQGYTWGSTKLSKQHDHKNDHLKIRKYRLSGGKLKNARINMGINEIEETK